MKRTDAYRAIAAVGLSLLLILTTTVTSAETTADYTAGLDTYMCYGFQPLPNNDACYCFDLDEMCRDKSFGLTDGLLENTEMQNGYNAYYEKLQSVHGDPITSDKTLFSDQMGQFYSDIAWTNDIERISGWDLGNGQMAYLTDVGGKSSLYFYVPAMGTTKASDAGELMDGVSWGLTIDEMREKESASGNVELDAYSFDDGIQYSFIQQNDDDSKTYILYIYKHGQLVLYGQNGNEYCYPEGTVMQDIFDKWQAGLTGTYGEQTINDEQQLIDRYNALGGCKIDKENITAFNGWDLGDDTDLFLFNLNESNIFCIYANRLRIPGDVTTSKEGLPTVVGKDENELNDYEKGIRDYLQYGFVRRKSNWAYISFAIDLEGFSNSLLKSGDSVNHIALRISARMQFDQQFKTLKEKYGEPDNYDRSRFVSLFREATYDPYDEVYDVMDTYAFDIVEQDISQVSSWNLGNGQEIYLIRINERCLFYQFTDLTRYVPEDAQPDVEFLNNMDLDPWTLDDYIQVVFSQHFD